MKKPAYLLILITLLIVGGCSKDRPSRPVVQSIPKPQTTMGATAYAAKKADYFVRLAFDLADGYLYDNSVARIRYGTDSKYVRAINYDNISEGIAKVNNLGSFEMSFYKDDEFNVGTYNVLITSYAGISPGLTPENNRKFFILPPGRDTGKRFNIEFNDTDIIGENILFDIWYDTAGQFTRYGANFNNGQTFTFQFSIETTTGTVNFTATLNGVEGTIKDGYLDGHAFSSQSEFLITAGNMKISSNEHEYELNLNYSDNKSQGEFTGPEGFSAYYYMNETGNYDAYFIIDGDTTNKKNYVAWGFPS